MTSLIQLAAKPNVVASPVNKSPGPIAMSPTGSAILTVAMASC